MAVPAFLRFALVWILPLVSACTWLGQSERNLLLIFPSTFKKHCWNDFRNAFSHADCLGAWGAPTLRVYEHQPTHSIHFRYWRSRPETALYCRLLRYHRLPRPFLRVRALATSYGPIGQEFGHRGESPVRSIQYVELASPRAQNPGIFAYWSIVAVIFAIAGTCGLILLSIFDTLHHPHLHDGFLLLFIAGYVISAIFICAEYQRLGVHFRQHRILRLSFWLKLVFIIVEVIFAVIFAATTFESHQNVAAIFEWIIAFVFTFYVLTFFVDLLPAARSTQEHSNAETMHLKDAENWGAMMQNSGYTNGATANVLNGAAGYNGVGTGNYRPPAAQNFWEGCLDTPIVHSEDGVGSRLFKDLGEYIIETIVVMR